MQKGVVKFVQNLRFCCLDRPLEPASVPYNDPTCDRNLGNMCRMRYDSFRRLDEFRHDMGTRQRLAWFSGTLLY